MIFFGRQYYLCFQSNFYHLKYGAVIGDYLLGSGLLPIDMLILVDNNVSKTPMYKQIKEL
ncbi:hypothetical protein VL07_16840 [Bacillus safensis]|nr:hypothetical protein VL07_16840 [Bacillus safensis]KML48563.1 hypothetical protein VL18_16190 [Bacillus safensis]KMN80131.1 hypothetical protein VK99_03780 [Bacillus safensis]